MYTIRKSNERGSTKLYWLDSKHTFSFANYIDVKHMGFGPFRVINDDIVAPSEGFGLHPHDNMEIISIVLSGELEHRDSMGNTSVMKAGDIQKMSAGTGIFHSEFNASDKVPVHFLQIWIMPNVQNISPGYGQKNFPREAMLNKLCLIGSLEGEDNAFKIYQDANVYETIIEKEKTVSYQLRPSRKIWIHIATGSVIIKDTELFAGDGLGIREEDELINITGIADESIIIIFDMK